MSCEDNQDLALMKKLLTSWHVEILYDLFQEEDISIEELKMMQFSHINYLLKNYKMGVRIRFEHHLRSWRNKIGIPLQTEEHNCQANYGCHNNSNFSHESMECTNFSDATITAKEKTNDLDEATNNIDLEDFQQPLLSPQSIKSENSLIKMISFNEMPNLTPIPILGSPNHQSNHTDEDGDTLGPLYDLLTTTLSDTPPKFPSKPAPEQTAVNLKQILRLSGSRGMSIVKYYKEKKCLTSNHRTQLIQTIVDFFEDNDYHLSLNMSHNLEWEIVKMFPTEKLEYYRTEKRGKLYVKFTNMKRYKRERGNKCKIESETNNVRSRRFQQNQNTPLDELITADNENMDAICDDAWPDVDVKQEILSDK